MKDSVGNIEVQAPPVAVFSPDLLLSVAIEARAGADDLHVHAAGQGVWVAKMAAELGSAPILCSLCGGETGSTVQSLLENGPVELRVARTFAASGGYVVDNRGGGRDVLANSSRQAPVRHELDDLVALTCAAALESKLLVLCNPFPAEGVPLEVYETIAANARAAGVGLLVDLSSPRLDCVLAHRPDLVKLNDWELAEYVSGPVDGVLGLETAMKLREAGARNVAVTRAGAPILVVPEDGEPFEIVPPEFTRGFREGCGDAMMGAVAAAWARGSGLRDALHLGAAAGSADFLRHGLGTGRREAIEALLPHVSIRALGPAQTHV